MPVDTSIYRQLQTPHPSGIDAFQRAFAQQTQINGLRDERDALAEQRRAATEKIRQETALAKKTQFETEGLTALFGSGQPVEPKQVYSLVGPERGSKILDAIQATQKGKVEGAEALRQHIGAMIGGIEALPDPMRAGGYARVRDSAIQQGWAKPEEIPEQYDPAYVAGIRKSLLTPKERTDTDAAALRDADAAKESAARLGGLTADSTIKGAVAAGMKGGLTPAEQQAAADRAAQTRIAGMNAAETARHNRKTEANAPSALGLGADGRPLADTELLARAQADPVAKQIAEYRLPPPAASRMGTAESQRLLAHVAALNPEYRGDKFQSAQRLRTAFTSGAQSQTLNALNTAIEHLDQFKDAAEALGNGNFKPGNQVYNTLRETFGSTAPTNFNGIKTIMSGELASAFKKSGATDTEIAHVMHSLDNAGSTAQLVDYVTKVAIPALGSKAGTYEAQWKQTMGEGDTGFSAYTPGAKKVLDKYGALHGSTAATPAKPGAPGTIGRFKVEVHP